MLKPPTQDDGERGNQGNNEIGDASVTPSAHADASIFLLHCDGPHARRCNAALQRTFVRNADIACGFLDMARAALAAINS
jgi:hypothetical protein